MRYNIGDEIILKVEDSFGYDTKTYRSVSVQVIGYNVDCEWPSAEYIVYVPPYEWLKNSYKLSKQEANTYNINSKFIDTDIAFIQARNPIYKHIPAQIGENCIRCKEFFAGAVKVNDSYKCRACTLNPWR